MPHLEAEPPISAGGKKINFVDLNIEKYPLPKEERDELFKQFFETGLVGNFFGVNLHFKPDFTISIAKNQENIRQLPKGWEKHMKFVSEISHVNTSLPKLTELFSK